MDSFNLKDLEREGNLYLIPPYIDEKQKKIILNEWKSLEVSKHVFILSSGTTGHGNTKTYLLSKEALFENAKMVNDFLKASANDCWLVSLPFYHVGGLSIYFRARLSGARVIEFKSKWSVAKFIESLCTHKITHCSLVPTQLYALVMAKKKAPENLQAVFVGGDFLGKELGARALKLGWPLIATYGMTEVCSQLATTFYKDLADGHLKVLPGHKLIKDKEDHYLKSPALYTATMIFQKDGSVLYEPLSSDQMILPDKISLKETESTQWVKPMGRLGSEVKIKGKLVDERELRDSFEQKCFEENIWDLTHLQLLPCPINGTRIIIRAEKPAWTRIEKVTKHLVNVYPYLKDLVKVSKINHLERNSLGKVKLLKS